MHNLSSVTKRIRVAPDDGATTTFTLAAGTSDKTTVYVDMLGYSSILWRVGWGAITAGAVTSIKAQQCDTSGGSYADLTGTSQTVADTADNSVSEVEIHRPQERYQRLYIDRGTQNAVIDFVEAILYNPRNSPPTQDSTVAGTETFNTPAEGTA